MTSTTSPMKEGPAPVGFEVFEDSPAASTPPTVTSAFGITLVPWRERSSSRAPDPQVLQFFAAIGERSFVRAAPPKAAGTGRATRRALPAKRLSVTPGPQTRSRTDLSWDQVHLHRFAQAPVTGNLTGGTAGRPVVNNRAFGKRGAPRTARSS